ncbi:MAG TPA: glycosyltransferase family 9 protein [Verrucomicrobiae bacterium]|nr:glycosyltransferase family 9 protein [Verrucomicrobiae bacterium]
MFFSVRARAASYDPARVKKILLVRLDHVGDLVMTLPAAARVRGFFPNAEIHWLIPTSYEPLLRPFAQKWNLKLISYQHNWFAREQKSGESCREAKTLIRQFQKENYDLGIDFRGDLRNILLLWRSRIRFRAGYGATGGGFLLTHQPEHDRGAHPSMLSRRLLESLGIPGELHPVPLVRDPQMPEGLRECKSLGHKILAVHPGAAHVEKRWPQERFDALIAGVREKDWAWVVIVGDARDKEEIALPRALKSEGVLDMRGKIPLHELPALLSGADLFVGNDSGPGHIAAAQGVPLISIFSTVNNPEAWKPWSEKLRLIARPLQEITVGEVLEAVQSLLGAGSRT